MKKTVFTAAILALSVFTFLSCKKEKEPTTPTTGNNEYSNSFPLKVGNYWVYELRGIDKDGNTVLTTLTDSSYIAKDTLINGNTWYRLESNTGGSIGYRILRDSAGYIVASNGAKYMSYTDFGKSLGDISAVAGTDTLYTAFARMNNVGQPDTVPAGIFKTVSLSVDYTLYPALIPGGAKRNTFIRFSPNVGPVHRRDYSDLLAGTYTERLLLRYHIN